MRIQGFNEAAALLPRKAWTEERDAEMEAIIALQGGRGITAAESHAGARR